MTSLKRFIMAAGVATVLAGCSTINSLTGQNDNTVLPGQREDAIPGRTKFPEASDAGTIRPGQPASEPAGGSEPPPATACQDGDPGCAPPQGDGTFSDPQ